MKRDPWEDWEGVQVRIEDRYCDELVSFGVALGELPGDQPDTVVTDTDDSEDCH